MGRPKKQFQIKLKVEYVAATPEDGREAIRSLAIMYGKVLELKRAEAKGLLPAAYRKDPAQGFEPISGIKRGSSVPAAKSQNKPKKKKGISLGGETPFLLPAIDWLPCLDT